MPHSLKDFMNNAYWSVLAKFGTKKKTHNEKLAILAETITNGLFYDKFEGYELSSEDISFVLKKAIEISKTKLLEKSKFHSSEAEKAIQAHNSI